MSLLDCTSTYAATNDSTASALSFEDLKQAFKKLEALKPPPRKEFRLADGLVHAVYEDGALRVSPPMYELLKRRLPKELTTSEPEICPAFGTRVEIDVHLPGLGRDICTPRLFLRTFDATRYFSTGT